MGSFMKSWVNLTNRTSFANLHPLHKNPGSAPETDVPDFFTTCQSRYFINPENKEKFNTDKIHEIDGSGFSFEKSTLIVSKS